MEVTHSLSRNMQGELYLIANRDNGTKLQFSPDETRLVYQTLKIVFDAEKESDHQ